MLILFLPGALLLGDDSRAQDGGQGQNTHGQTDGIAGLGVGGVLLLPLGVDGLVGIHLDGLQLPTGQLAVLEPAAEPIAAAGGGIVLQIDNLALGEWRYMTDEETKIFVSKKEKE